MVEPKVLDADCYDAMLLRVAGTLVGAAGAGAQIPGQARAVIAEVLEQLATWPMHDPGSRPGAPEARHDNAWLTRADVQALADQAIQRERSQPGPGGHRR